MTMLLLPAPYEARDEPPAPTSVRASILPRALRAAASSPASVPSATPSATPVPCAARPGTQLRHLDGPCECFFGGRPPEFAPSGGTPA